jgi:hypothetical protein
MPDDVFFFSFLQNGNYCLHILIIDSQVKKATMKKKVHALNLLRRFRIMLIHFGYLICTRELLFYYLINYKRVDYANALKQHVWVE